MAAKTKDYKSYLLNKCIVGYGIINGIINALVFWGMSSGNPNAAYTQGKIIEEMALTGALLGLILTWCVVPLTKKDLKKGVYQGEPGLYGLTTKLPRKTILMSLAVGVIALVVVAALSWVFTLVLPLPLSRTGMMVFKGCMCAVVGGISGWCVIGRTTSA